MIILYLKSINKIIRDPDPKVFEELGYDDLLWIDLVVPTAKERKLVESFLDVNLLTRQQAEEIETSSRYSELEDSIICNTSFTILKDGRFEVETVSFILSEGLLVSERNSDLRTFSEASRKIQMNYRSYTTGYHVLVSILEARIDLDADMVEIISRQIAALNATNNDVDKSVDKEALLEVNRLHENTINPSESIFDRQRLLSGIQRSERFPNDIYPRVTVMIKGVGALLNPADFSSERLEFLQDTFMGLISMEQNKIIKMFTILSVIFMPPTLIAGIYGMNYRLAPFDEWEYGFHFAILLMLLSIGITLYFFKRKKRM